MKEEIIIDGQLCAIIIFAAYNAKGIQFLTGKELSQQLASICHPAGKIILAHTHNPAPREVSLTQEALFIRSGRVRVDFYSQRHEYCKSRVLGPGDVILMIKGGHGFEVLEELNMVEVKQGPYVGEADKVIISSVLPTKLNYD